MSIFPINHWIIVYVERQISHAFWKYRDRNHLSFSVMLTRLKLGMSERGRWRPLQRRPRVPVVLDLRWRAVEQVSEAKVSISGDSGEGNGTVDKDGGWKFVDDHGDRIKPDLAMDLRPIGVKSKF